MTRQKHNAYYQVDRKPDERVHCNTLGYGELSQYDSECGHCWYGTSHTWEQHDRCLGASDRRAS